jgi:ABC-type Co2+ transport system permease subunit
VRRPPAPLFLARRSYRRRRLRDAARLLPVLGLFFFLLPMLWLPATPGLPDTAWKGIYLFVIWGGLVAVAFVLAPGLSSAEEDQGPAEDDG